jgi:AcrR family transcriptional regulator
MTTSAQPLLSRREARRADELARRRSDVVVGAAEVFATKGYHDAQISEIAAAAEVSLGSLYATFAGKDEIYQAVLESTADHMRVAVRHPIDQIEDATEALLALIDTMFAVFEDNAHILRLTLSGTGGLPWRIRANTKGISGRGVDSFVSWLTEICDRAVGEKKLRGIDAKALALMLAGSVLQTAAHSIDHTPEVPLSKSAPHVRAIFERILKPGD